MTLQMRGSGSLDINPPIVVDLALSDHSSEWLWAVKAVYTISFVRSYSFSIYTSRSSANSVPSFAVRMLDSLVHRL